METLGRRIKRVREERGLRLQDVADRAHMDKSTISLYESGARTPSLPALLQLAKALNVSAAFLLGETPSTVPDALLDTPARVAENPSRYGLREIEIAPGTKAYIPEDAELSPDDLQLIRDILEARRKRQQGPQSRS